MSQSHDLPEQQANEPDPEVVPEPDEQLDLDPADPEVVAHASDRDVEELAHVDDPDPEAAADEFTPGDLDDDTPGTSGARGGS